MAECGWRIVDGTIDVTVVIPPNTSAIVNLPGSDAAPIEVGSGSHHWSYHYQDPDAHPPLTLEHPISAFIDSPTTWDLVLQTVARITPSPFMRGTLASQSRTSLRLALAPHANSDAMIAALEVALGEPSTHV
jgi:alpha-L-rhamnosidase